MQIQINSDNNIEGNKEFLSQIEEQLNDQLERFSDRISRIEIHMSDENGPKNGTHDLRCLLEVRIEGRQPLAVSHNASTLDFAFNGAIDKLKKTLESTFDRIQKHR